MDTSDRSLYLIAVIRPRPERAAEAEAQLRVLMEGTRAEAGCVYMQLVISADDPDTWFMFEKFRSRPDWEAHMRTEHVTAGNARLTDLLREPTELQFYTEK